MGGKSTIIQKYPDEHYSVVFNQRNGYFVRIEDRGHNEPFWSEHGPELLDISITNYCTRGCHFCYRGSNSKGQHMSFEDYKRLIRQAEEVGVLQVALGGGNPNQHPDFIKILKETVDHNIVPSYTSNGDGLTSSILKATKNYCGAIAISAYPPYAILSDNIKHIANHGIKLNLHFLLTNDSIEKAIKWLSSPPDFFEYINAIVFLNYKPILSAATLNVVNSEKISLFFEAVQKSPSSIKIGFDSCSISGVASYLDVNPKYYESCESARFSAFISEDLKMYPCSFMQETKLYGDLRVESLLEIWKHNNAFKNHRDKIQNHACSGCKYGHLCSGGCVFLPEINLCKSII